MTVLIIGAKSDIAKATAREFAKNGFDLILAGRRIEELNDFKKDIEIRFNKNVILKKFDITDFNSHKEFYASLENKPNGVIIASGVMYEQTEVIESLEKTLNTINVNFIGAVSILNIIANDFRERQSGFIIGISSVAGDKGRKTNYIYGSSKAGFSTYLSGLRNDLFNDNIQVITIKPGFVYTKMTAHLDLPEKLTATPDEIAKGIFKAYKNKKDIVYLKPVWKFIMCIIIHIPERIFKRMSI